MMEKRLLTVCIPTYNRSIVIEDLIKLLLFQINEYGLNDCAIAISDNSDNELTEKILESYLVSYPTKIYYHRNETNIGPFRNLDKVGKMVDSEYIWFLGDDDFIFSYSLLKIRNFILANKERELGFIFLNSCSMDSDLDFINNPNESEIREDSFYEKGDFALLHNYRISSLGHFSRLVYKQDIWKQYNNVEAIQQFEIYPQINTQIATTEKEKTAFFSSIVVINTKRKKDETKAASFWSGLVLSFWSKEFLELNDKIEKSSKRKLRIRKDEYKKVMLSEWKMAVNRDAYASIYDTAKKLSKTRFIFTVNFFIADLVFLNKKFRNRMKNFMRKKYNMSFLD